MGRPTTWEMAFRQAYRKAYAASLDSAVAGGQAEVAAEAAEQERRDHRRKKNAEYQRRHRARKRAEQGQQLGDVTISVRLTKDALAALDAEAGATRPDLTPEQGRWAVLASLIAPLVEKHQRPSRNSEGKPWQHLKSDEENIYALQMLIASERQKGTPDNEILENVRKSTTMSLDEIMEYQFQTATIP